MNNLNSIANLADGKDTYLGNASLDKTLQAMIRIASDNKGQVKDLSDSLKGNSVLATSENIFDWVRANIKYKKDELAKEQLRTPARSIRDKQGDCDCTSILISSLLQNLRIPHFFRVVDVSGNGWEHVYIIAINEQGDEISLDTVPEILHFNFEHPHKKRKDFMITTLNGLDDLPVMTSVRRSLEEIKIALEVLPKDQEVKLEIALVKTSIAFLDDEENRVQVLQNAADRSKYFSGVYSDILKLVGDGQLGEFVAAVTAATTLVNFGKNITNGIKNIFGKKTGVGGVGEVAVKPGDTFQDAQGNVMRVLDNFDSGLGYSMSINSGPSTGAFRVSEVAMGIDGKLYIRNRGGRDNDPDYFVMERDVKTGNAEGIRFLYKAPKNDQGQWPTPVLELMEQIKQEEARAQQQSQKNANIPSQFPQQGNSLPQQGNDQGNNNGGGQTRSLGEQSFFEKNKVAIIITAVLVGLAITGTTIVLATKK